MKEPREYTEKEVRAKFLKHIWGLIAYWEREHRAPTSQEKLEGLAHSIMSMLDGNNGGIPAFIVAPLPDKGDKEWSLAHKENYFPYNPRNADGSPTNVNCDIAGSLARQLFLVKE